MCKMHIFIINQDIISFMVKAHVDLFVVYLFTFLFYLLSKLLLVLLDWLFTHSTYFDIK